MTSETEIVKKLVEALKRMTMYSESLVDGNRDDYNWIVQADEALTEANAWLERQEARGEC